MKKRFVSGILALTLILSVTACGNTAQAPVEPDTKESSVTVDNTTADEKPEKTDSETDTVKADEKEPEEKLEAEQKPAADPVLTVSSKRLEIKEQYVPSEGDPFSYGFTEYPQFAVSDDLTKAYPKLAAAVSQMNEDYRTRALKTLAEEADYAQEFVSYDDPFFFTSNEQIWTPDVERADDKLLSMSVTEEFFYNGPHPNMSFDCINIDTQTGEKIKLSDVIKISDDLPELIRKNFETMDPDYEYSESEIESILETIKNMIKDDQLVWTLDDEGLNIYFGAYDLMFYAFGPIFSTLTFKDNSGLFQDKYLPGDNGAKIKVVKDDKDVETEFWSAADIAKYYEPYDWETEGEGDVDISVNYVVTAPDWKKKPYISADATDPNNGESLVTLEEKKVESSDWLDQNAWASTNKIFLPRCMYNSQNGYSKGDYSFYTDNSDHSSLILNIYDAADDNAIDGMLLWSVDFSDFMNTPSEGDKYSLLEIPYAEIVDGILYVEIAHRTYASSQPYTGYIVAVDLSLGEVIWRSDMLVANGWNFSIIDDQIICGYGFTAEDDYINILSIHTGEVLNKWKVKSAPDYFVNIDGATMYVLTYNTAYTYDISYG